MKWDLKHGIEVGLGEAPVTSGFLYLASPYSKHPEGMEEAERRARHVAAVLTRRWHVTIYSPIVHGHAMMQTRLAQRVRANPSNPTSVDHHVTEHLPTDDAFWWAKCRPMMDAAAGLLVFLDDGWRQSRGVTYELGYMQGLGKPISTVQEKVSQHEGVVLLDGPYQFRSEDV